MKLRLLAVSLAALTLGAGSAMAQNTSTEQGQLSYALGYDLGRNLVESGEQIDVDTVIQAVRDGYARRDPTVPVEQLRGAVENMQQRQLAQARQEFERVSTENKTRSDQYLAQNRSKSGVQALDGGVQYRVIEAGSGARPNPNSEVTINYKGSLTTGQTFVDTTAAQEGQQAGPVSVRIDQIPLEGLREALAQMQTGARWEVVLPPDKAYGNTPQSPVGPNQAVVFEVQLVSVN
ncbi:FKBP-type peptidyl-prolyl cis-trans isomerase N-terminal domain-containing protein [Luteimonas abyssi]|uniref:FKBP-type peptidyl-prolyl cis-trans isomerase N-terminal domain-containing protein n=1 Tax=Luteimonas abyssi TaxID=1247514 RepID=UPI000737C575|nr:FKBP-type peptidyl-prolyl cis-trans isomerase N-terminal domain-containing protein [Luteimonas abyssi]